MKKYFTFPLTRLLALALLVASGIFNAASAQDLSSELISYPSKLLEQLPSKHRQTANELTEGKNVTTYLARINSIKDAVRDNTITLMLPGSEGAIKVVLDRIEYYDEKNYTVAGKVENTLLTVLFSSHEGRKGGLIQGFESSYYIYDLEEEGQLLVKSNNSEGSENFCGLEQVSVKPRQLTEQVPTSTSRKSSSNARVDACTSNIRVLFLHDTYIGPSTATSYAYNAIDILNQAISASSVNNSLAYAQLAGVASINYTPSDQSDITADAVHLSNNPTAQGLRDTYKADLVVLISHEYYNGLGGVPDPSIIAHPNNGRAYAIVSTSGNSTVPLVAAHELSHLYGCNHEDVAYGLYYSKAKLFGGPNNNTYKTLVARASTNSISVIAYSNPNKTYNGYAMGDASSNNTQVMSSNAGGVKNFRPEPNVLSAYIDGPYSGIAYHMYTFESVVSCGSAPYSYQWRVSTDGFNYGSVLGTGEYFNTHLYHNGNHWHYIKLTVTSADNQTKESTRQIWVEDNNPYRVGVMENVVVDNTEKEFQDGTLYPNPVSTSAKVDLELTEAGNVSVDIYSTGGTLIARPLSQRMERGKHRQIVPLDKYALPDGEYLIRVQTPKKVKTYKAIYRHETH